MIIYDEGQRMDVCPNCGTTWTRGYCLDCGMEKCDEPDDAEYDNED